MNVSEIRIHEHFNNSSLDNNIALVLFDDPELETVDIVRPVCLPDENQFNSGQECFVSGFETINKGKVGTNIGPFYWFNVIRYLHNFVLKRVLYHSPA